jgi:hypothetical protein
MGKLTLPVVPSLGWPAWMARVENSKDMCLLRKIEMDLREIHFPDTVQRVFRV